MKIEIVRGGGLAGLATRTGLDIDTLDPESAQALLERVRNAGLLGPAASVPPGAGSRYPDELLYEITAYNGDLARTARYSETELPDSVRQLITWVDGRRERSEGIEPPNVSTI
jgi:hypothetical protein